MKGYGSCVFDVSSPRSSVGRSCLVDENWTNGVIISLIGQLKLIAE
jgi:hypothetical protein